MIERNEVDRAATVSALAEVDRDEISLKEVAARISSVLRLLVSKWKVIFLCGIVGGILGASYAYIKKPVYVSQSTFVLEDGDGSSGIGQYAGLASMVGLDLGSGGGLFHGDNILELYKSRKMIAKTLLVRVNIQNKSELLIDRYIEISNLKQSWSERADLKNISFKGDPKYFSRTQDSVITQIVKNILAHNLEISKSDKKSGVITVIVKSHDEFFSKEFNDVIVENVNDFYIETKTKRSLQNLNLVQRQADSVRNILNGAIAASAAALDATPNLNPARQSLRVPVQRSQFSAEANKAIFSQLIQNLELAKLSLRKETPLIQIIDQPVYPLEKVKLGKAISGLIGFTIFSFTAFIVILTKKVLKSLI